MDASHLRKKLSIGVTLVALVLKEIAVGTSIMHAIHVVS